MTLVFVILSGESPHAAYSMELSLHEVMTYLGQGANCSVKDGCTQHSILHYTTSLHNKTLPDCNIIIACIVILTLRAPLLLKRGLCRGFLAIAYIWLLHDGDFLVLGICVLRHKCYIVVQPMGCITPWHCLELCYGKSTSQSWNCADHGYNSAIRTWESNYCPPIASWRCHLRCPAWQVSALYAMLT